MLRPSVVLLALSSFGIFIFAFFYHCSSCEILDSHSFGSTGIVVSGGLGGGGVIGVVSRSHNSIHSAALPKL